MHEHPRRHSRPRRVLSASAAALVAGLSLAAAPAYAGHEEPLVPPGDLVAVANDTRSVGWCGFHLCAQMATVTGPGSIYHHTRCESS